MGLLIMLLSLPYDGVARFANNDPVNSIDPLGLRVTRSDIQADRMKYTCLCGWIDTSHTGPYADKFKKIWDAIQKSKSGYVDLESTMPGITGTTTRSRRYQYDYTKEQSFDAFTAAFQLLYRAAYQEEVDQGSGWAGRRWTAFSYEDIGSDVIGGMIGYEMVSKNLDYAKALETVLKNCEVVTKDQALKVFDANPSDTFSKVVKSAKQPECIDPVCTEEQKKKKYEIWDKAAGIATGKDPGGTQPFVPQP
jgi:dsDNA-binding SOS-regulon protein